jgi:hypothetical protein
MKAIRKILLITSLIVFSFPALPFLITMLIAVNGKEPLVESSSLLGDETNENI